MELLRLSELKLIFPSPFPSLPRSLEPVLELLELVWPLLDHVDRPLGCALRALGLPAYFALTWFITWFAHDAKTLEVRGWAPGHVGDT